jgi:hypothetical protein
MIYVLRKIEAKQSYFLFKFRGKDLKAKIKQS